MNKDLRHFIQLARIAGPACYAEARRPVDPAYEAGAIQLLLAKEGRFPMLHCPTMRHTSLPFVSGLFAGYHLLALALDLPAGQKPGTERRAAWAAYASRRDKPLKPMEILPSQAPVRQRVIEGSAVDLGSLPITRHSEFDGGPYITAGVMLVRDPDTGLVNAGMYRHQILGRNIVACNMGPAKHGSRVARRHADLGRRLEAVLMIGHHPAIAIGSVTRNRPDLDQLEHMGAVLGEPLEVTRGLTVDLPVPAYAEIALEGTIDPTRKGREGPFGDYWGTYGEGHECYVMEVTAITMRADAIYHDLCPTHQEHAMISMVEREYLVYRSIVKAVPAVTDVRLGPHGSTGKSLVYIQLRKNSDDEVSRAAQAALQANPRSKIAVVVDADVDVDDQAEVLWAAGTRLEPGSGLTVIRGGAADDSPAAATRTGASAKHADNDRLIVDATFRAGGSPARRAGPPKAVLESLDLHDCLKP